jgi:hypothetical protein
VNLFWLCTMDRTWYALLISRRHTSQKFSKVSVLVELLYKTHYIADFGVYYINFEFTKQIYYSIVNF